MILPLLLTLITVIEVRGHGRLIEPPSRSSMWRFGFKTEPNYNDNELFCGGFTIQWKRNGGKCGICGDPWHMPQPRENEAGGKYGKGIIVRNYTVGQIIDATAQLTANHKGYFEFKICPTNDPLKRATQECFDQYPLKVVETSEYKYILPDHQSRNFNVHLQLPKDLECTRCVLQWTYTSGNTWGPCPEGGSKTGCGPQETFRGCADVRILGNSTESNHTSSTDSNEIYIEDDEFVAFRNRLCGTQTEKNIVNNDIFESILPTTVTDVSKTVNSVATTINSVITTVTGVPTTTSTTDVLVMEKLQGDSPNGKIRSEYESCKGTGLWKKVPGIDNWCIINCSRGYCPSSHCQC